MPLQEPGKSGGAGTPGGRSAARARLVRLASARRWGSVDPRHARQVRRLKYILPAIAIVLIGLVAAWPMLQRNVTPPLDLEPTRAGEIINPRFVGVDDENRPFTITAVMATQAPDDPGRITMEKPQADLTDRDGSWYTVLADRAFYDRTAGSLELRGSVNLFRDDGTEILTDEVNVALDRRDAWGDLPVVAHGPWGELNARGFRIDNGGDTVVFTGPARLVLTNEGKEQGDP